MLGYSPEFGLGDLPADPRLISRTLRPAALREELGEVRERGFAREKDEAILGESSTAAPIFDQSGHAVGAIGVDGDTDRIVARGAARQPHPPWPRRPEASHPSSAPAAGPL